MWVQIQLILGHLKEYFMYSNTLCYPEEEFFKCCSLISFDLEAKISPAWHCGKTPTF